jgi:peptidoglycan/LPS O-acetylase OafA/YrhL
VSVAARTLEPDRDLRPREVHRIRPADGVRGLAALAIVAHHASFATGRTYDGDLLADVNARLDVGVAVFFALSGFLLFEPYARRIVDDAEFPSKRKFWTRRAVRVYPAFWVALVIQLALGVIMVKGVVGFLLAASLTHIYVADHLVTGITQSWTVATEIGFYVLLPFIAVLGRHLSRGRTTSQRLIVLVGVCAGFALVSVVSRVVFLGLDLPGRATFRYSVFANADYFAAGMMLACLMVGVRHSERFAALHARAFRTPGWWYAAAAAVMWFTSTQLDVPLGLTVGAADVELARQAGYLLVALLVVAPACCARSDTALSARLLGSRPLVFLGMVSYGLYLWHQVFLTGVPPNDGWIFEWTGWPPFDAPFLQVFVIASIGGIALGTLSWYLVERPLLRRFR